MIGIGRLGRLVLIGLPFAWLALFFLLPLLIVAKISLARSVIGIPPYTPLFFDDGSGLKIHATLANFALLASDDLYLRVYAWIAILKPNGLLNQLLIAVGLTTTPLPLLNNAFSVELGLVYSYLPFMILPLYGSLTALDESLLEAAADLGARPFRT